MTPMKQFHRQQGNTIMQNLKRRNMSAYYCDTSVEAVELASSLIEEHSTVSYGGSMTIVESGMMNKLKEGNYKLLDRNAATTPEEIRSIYLKSFDADTYLMSANAISLDGQLVNIDGRGNRVAALIYGPKQVIVMIGMNKVESTLEDAINRVQNFAAPANTQRLNRQTPCRKTGFCHDCQSDDCICCNTVITRRSGEEGRIKVILVGEVLGF